MSDLKFCPQCGATYGDADYSYYLEHGSLLLDLFEGKEQASEVDVPHGTEKHKRDPDFSDII